MPRWLHWMFPLWTWRGPRGGTSIYLTFDDGPTAGVTESVLDCLVEHDARATIFLLGRQIENILNWRDGFEMPEMRLGTMASSIGMDGKHLCERMRRMFDWDGLSRNIVWDSQPHIFGLLSVGVGPCNPFRSRDGHQSSCGMSTLKISVAIVPTKTSCNISFVGLCRLPSFCYTTTS